VSGRFALVMAWRESRGNRRRLMLTVTAVSLGVAALVAINSFSADVTASVRSQARSLLGADVELRSRAPFPDSVAAVLDSMSRAGVAVARVTSFASMVLAPRTGVTRLFEIRAVDGGFPFYGAVTTAPPGRWAELATRRGVLVDTAVLVHLDARVGDTVTIGEARFEIAGVVTSSPGEVGLRAALGPRVFLPARYLPDTRLLRFGSLARYRAYLRLPDDAAVQRFLNQHNALFERHRIGRDTAAEREDDLADALGRLARYLGLVGLAALLLGGLGVASAIRVFVRDRIDAAATLRCLGAATRVVFGIYLAQAVALGLAGATLGAALGIAVQALLPLVLRDLLPVDVAMTVHWPAVLTGLAIGTGIAALFALLPLLDLRRVPPLRALRRDFDADPRRRDPLRVGVYAVLAAALVALAMWQAPSRGIGAGFAAAVALTTAILWLIATGLVRATRRWFPTRARYVVRQGIANLFRPQNQTVPVVLAIGFGVFLIATLYVVQRSLLDQLAVDARPDRPNLVLFDIQVDQREGVAALVADRLTAAPSLTPLVPARIAAINGRVVDSILADTTGRGPSRWALRREYRNTYRDTLVASEQLVAGAWWHGVQTRGEPWRVSVEQDLAAELGIGVGDAIRWNVQGVPVDTRVASLRRVDWARFEPNFFVVFEPGVLEAAPQTFVLLARAEDPGRRAELQRDVVVAYPNVSVLDLTDVQRTLDRVLGQVALAIRFMALFSVGSGLVILIGALRASRLQRLREAALLKTLGARGRQIRDILLTEYLTWGSLAALTGVALATLASWMLARWVFEIAVRIPVLGLAGIWGAVCLLTVAVGLGTGREVLRATPLRTLRELSE